VEKIEREAPLLELDLGLNENIYQIGDTILATLSLKNIGQEPLIVNKRMINYVKDLKDLCEIAFTIVTPSGDEAYFVPRVNVRLLKKDDYTTLLPGDVITSTYEIDDYYSPLESPGNYTIYAIYQNYNDPGDGEIAWKGEIKSNTITFKLEP